MASKDKEMSSIKLNIYFHTNNMELGQKIAFLRGRVYMPTNHKHGIRASDIKEEFFFSKSQGSIMDAIKRCLAVHEVKLVKEEKASEYKKFKKMENEGEFFAEDIQI